MATKPKKKASAKKTASKRAAPKKVKPKARKPRKRATKPKGPAVQVPNHRFAPGTEVSFLPVHMVTVERGMNREPFAEPIKKAKVDKNGILEIRGLSKGQWCAAGPVGEGWIYTQFAVK
jgi:hypothetical protein